MTEFLVQVLRFFVSLAGLVVAGAGVVTCGLFLAQGNVLGAATAAAAMLGGFLTLGGLAALCLIEEHLARLRFLSEAAETRAEAEKRATGAPRSEPPVRRAASVLDSSFTLPKV